MRLNPLSLLGSSYADNALSWSAQRTLNWLPETAEVEGTRTPVKFADPPGLRAVVDLGTGAPIRGLENVEGKLFAVSSTSLFEIGAAFGVTNRGNIPGVTRVSIAHNKQGGATAANEVAIANGLSGYVYNTSTEVLSQITDDAFQGATTFDYVDGFITFTDPQGRFWGHSSLNQATGFSSIDRYDAESAPDPILSHIVSHREVMVFGTRTIEFFRNTGAATGTFQRVGGTEQEVGICAPHARSRVDNSVCWVGDSLEVFRLQDHQPFRISTRPIEQLLATVNPANIFTFAWEDRGHKVFYVTAPEAFTVGFDFASGMWHERQTFELPRWRVNALVPWNGYWIAGDYSNGLLYVLDWDAHHEHGLPLIRERASGYTHGGQNKVLAPYVELLFDVGPNVDPPEIVGDVPDGLVGDTVSGSYVVSGGIAPYSAITVQSGTFPPGLTLNPDGTWDGLYIMPGLYSWDVGGVDSIGQPFTLHDTAEVTALALLATGTNTAGSPLVGYLAPGSNVWTGVPFASVGNGGIPGYANGRALIISSAATHYSDDALASWQTGGVPGSTVNCWAYSPELDKIAVCGPNAVWTSDDGGESYTAGTNPFSGFAPSDVRWGGDRYIAVTAHDFANGGQFRYNFGDSPTWPQGPDVAAASGVTGLTLWTHRYDPIRERWWFFGGGNSASVTPGRIIYSDDLSAFNLQATTAANGAIVSVAWDGADNWIAVTFLGQILYTLDNWATHAVSAQTVEATSGAYQSAYIGGEFIVADNNAASPARSFRSPTGAVWSQVATMPVNDTVKIASRELGA